MVCLIYHVYIPLVLSAAAHFPFKQIVLPFLWVSEINWSEYHTEEPLWLLQLYTFDITSKQSKVRYKLATYMLTQGTMLSHDDVDISQIIFFPHNVP